MQFIEHLVRQSSTFPPPSIPHLSPRQTAAQLKIDPVEFQLCMLGLLSPRVSDNETGMENEFLCILAQNIPYLPNQARIEQQLQRIVELDARQKVGIESLRRCIC